MWEYKTKYFGVHELPIYRWTDYLNEEGRDKWELIDVIINKMINSHEDANYTFIFKRKKQ